MIAVQGTYFEEIKMTDMQSAISRVLFDLSISLLLRGTKIDLVRIRARLI
ncbi:Uncharacterised protein [Bartonella vinsonii]|uniref:Uncharacterized protein n=1 Tax=Bartonella vinsonii TaxID=33047 RepID=A0A448V4P2_BARVI|nr:Uncharacterised protein [Bartonella vinsonii]